MFRDMINWFSSDRPTKNRKDRKRHSRRNRFQKTAIRQCRLEPLEHRHLLVVGAFEVAALATPGNGFDGVVSVQSSSGVPGAPFNPFCTGSLLTTGRHILTAAHCVTDGDAEQNAFNAFIGFEMPDQNYFVPVNLTLPGALEIPDDWTGTLSDGYDLAIITLPVIAPFPAERYDIYRGNDELGQVFTLVGYGTTGTGTSGSLDLQPPPTFNGSLGNKRIGYNRWDVDANDLLGPDINATAAPPAGLALAYDFDNGDPAQDVFSLVGVDDVGLGESEAMQAPGDSGGPAFLRNRISGVVSYSRQRANPEEASQPDIDDLGNNTFGEYAVMTRVSAFADYIDGILTAPADVVLDMNFQPAGNNGVPDTVTARRDPENANRLELLINGQEVWSDLLSRVTSLTLIGSGDDDTFVIDGDFDVDITVDGGLGYDSLEIIGTGVGTATYTPSATTTGDGTVVIGGDTITFSNLEPLTVSNVPALTLVTPGSEDRVLVENTDTLGQIRVSGTSDGVVFESLTFFDVTTFTLDTGTNDGASPDDIITLNAPLPANGPTTFNILAGAGTDRVVYNGTAWDDTFEVTATGAVMLANASGSRLTVSSMTGVEQLVLIGLDGDDIFHVPGDHPFNSIVIEGGNPSTSDVLNFTGSGAGEVTIDLEARTVTENGFGPVAFSGVEIVNIAANASVTVLGTAGDDDLSYTPTGTAAGTLVLDGVNAVFHVSAVDVLTLDPADGVDTVTVHGNSEDNDIMVDRGATTTVQVDTLLAIELSDDTDALVVAAGLGDDTITVTGSAGPSLTVDGGQPTPGDTLQVAATDVAVHFGGDLSSGLLVTTGGDVSFSDISTINLTGDQTGTLTVHGTGDDDAINQNGNTVTINASAVVNFEAYDVLNLHGASGSDTFNVHPTTLAGVTELNIDGGDPTASDTVVVNGSVAQDTVDFAPTAADAMTITGLGPQVNLTATEHVIYNGQGGLDELTFTTPAGGDEVVFTPGSEQDSGTIAASRYALGGNTPLLPLTYQNVGATGSLTLSDADGLRSDDLVVRGTDTDDRFSVSSSGEVHIVRDAAPGIFTTLPMQTPGIDRLLLQGLDGDDVFDVAGDHPFASVSVEGGDPSASDVLNFTGSGAGEVTVDLEARTVTETGFGPVTFSGIEHVQSNTGMADLTVLGTPDDDLLTYTPTGVASGTYVLDGMNTAFSFSNLGTSVFEVNLGDDHGDHVVVMGTNSHDVITVDASNRRVDVENVNGVVLAPIVLHASVETVTVKARLGHDTIIVVPAPQTIPAPAGFLPHNLLIHVDGGPPSAGDALVIAGGVVRASANAPVTGTNPLGAADFVVVNRSRRPDEGTVRVFRGANAMPDISYTDIEIVSPMVDPVDPNTGHPNLLWMGPDMFEGNETRATAAYLGSGDVINVQNLTIFPNANEHRFVPADVDYFRVVAKETGTLDFHVYFRSFADTLMPGGGSLDVEVLDTMGNVIASQVDGFHDNSAPTPPAPNDSRARIRIPAVQGETYYLRVFGADGATLAVNGYDLTVFNQAPPVPFDIELADQLTILSGNQEVPPLDTIANGTANFQYDATANTFDLDLFVYGIPLDQVTGVHIHRGAIGVNGPVIVDLGAAWVQEGTGIRLRLTDHPFPAAEIANLLAGETYINVHTITHPPGEVRGQILIPNVRGVSDTGRSQFDNVTKNNMPTIFVRLDDAIFLNDLPGNAAALPGAISIPFNPDVNPANAATDPGFRVGIFVENNTHSEVLLGFAQPLAGLNGVYAFTFVDPLADGSWFISSRVQMIDPAVEAQSGWGPRSQSLEIVVDTVPPPVAFGSAADPFDGLLPPGDTHILPNPGTIIDRITSELAPTFWGHAEANAIVRLYADVDGDGVFDPEVDVFLGQTTAIPLDGTNQEPNGYWEIRSVVNLNNPDLFPLDGLRTIFATAEDLAGNVNAADGTAAADTLQIFIDTQGPVIEEVFITDVPDYNLFAPKPETDGPTPLVNSLTIRFSDLPERVAPDFLFDALKQDVAEHPGHYLLVGDHNGVIPIQKVIVTNHPPQAGQPARATVELVFRDPGPDGIFFTGDDIGAPLPDDRFTLTIFDSIVDLAGNRLDGETNAIEPHEFPQFPTGDGIPGGDFVARFTIDSRPEIGVYHSGSVWVDTNGNWVFDPDNLDHTNRDIVYTFGVTTDKVFAGNFAAPGAANADGFDKLAAYGRIGDSFRWLIDWDNNGVPNDSFVEPMGRTGYPVAGNFDGNAATGDQVGLFAGGNWYFDTTHDYRLDTTVTIPGMYGIPFVGDFNGDGLVDLGTWYQDTFYISLADTPGGVGPMSWSTTLVTFDFGFIGVRERPVVADFDQDGYDDIGLWVPDRLGANQQGVGEWYILVSGGQSLLNRITPDLSTGRDTIPFTPIPFGNDIYATFGNEFAIPVVGNFDPPVAAGSDGGTVSSYTNPRDPFDVNNDELVTPQDVLVMINDMNQYGARTLGEWVPGSLYLDVNADGDFTPADILAVINRLNDDVSGGEGEWSPSAAEISSVTVPLAMPTAAAISIGAAVDSPSAAGIDSLFAESDEGDDLDDGRFASLSQHEQDDLDKWIIADHKTNVSEWDDGLDAILGEILGGLAS